MTNAQRRRRGGRKARAEARLAASKRAYVRRFLLAYMGELRRILKRISPAYKRRFPNAPPPCHTCAFNPGTDDWPGMETTLSGLLRQIGNDQPFYCHEGLPTDCEGNWVWDPEKAKLCQGFAMIQNAPGVKLAIVAASRKAGPMPDEIAAKVLP